MLRRAAITISVVLSLLCLAQAPAMADKLVVFKNGKAMKVKSVTNDGKWAKCEFEDKNFLSVHASSILSVEDAALGSNVGELRPTQVAAGSGGGGGFNPGPGGLGGGGGLPPEVPASSDEVAQAQADMQAALAEEQAARQQQGNPRQNNNLGIGRRGQRIGGQPIPMGNPFQNRSLTQRGNNAPVNAVPGGLLRPTNQNQPGNSEN